MPAINGIEWCTEDAFREILALDPRLASIAKVHTDDFRASTTDTIVVKAVAGEHSLAGCRPLELICEIWFHQGKESQLNTGKTVGAIEGAVYHPSTPITTANCPSLLNFKYFDILPETTNDRSNDKQLRNRVTKIPLLALLIDV